ncbi:hypothetical protein [Kitasatospora viridis]|uniref:hypothetical protein n=1 Tax=Kitasatospora viridis TaxID=281105 RepID=UPI0011A89845
MKSVLSESKRALDMPNNQEKPQLGDALPIAPISTDHAGQHRSRRLTPASADQSELIIEAAA